VAQVTRFLFAMLHRKQNAPPLEPPSSSQDEGHKSLRRSPLRPGGRAASLRSACLRRSPIVIGAGCSGAAGPLPLLGAFVSVHHCRNVPPAVAPGPRGPREGFRAAFSSLCGSTGALTLTHCGRIDSPNEMPSSLAELAVAQSKKFLPRRLGIFEAALRMTNRHDKKIPHLVAF
jgi:hypothetical protein